MALVPCPECQREVSTEARECPQCAFPYPGKTKPEIKYSGTRPTACPRCHGPISRQIQVCPHCGVSLIKKPATGKESRKSTIPSSSPRHGSLLVDTGKRKISSGMASGQGSRRRVPLWQEPSAIEEIRPAHHRRHPSKSILVGLILVVIVTISVVFGALWQLEGLSPLEAILNWRM